MPSKTKILLQPVGCEEDEKSWAKGAMANAIIFYMVIFFLFLSRELMFITLSFLGLEGHSSSYLEDDGIGHGHLHNSSLRQGGRWPWSSFPS